MVEEKDGKKVKILLVDDQPGNLFALEAILESPDYLLIQATSGKEALRHILRHDIALILLDVQMPELDGFQTAALIKQSEKSKDVPLIFVDAVDRDEGRVDQGYAVG